MQQVSGHIGPVDGSMGEAQLRYDFHVFFIAALIAWKIMKVCTSMCMLMYVDASTVPLKHFQQVSESVSR